MNLFKQEHPVLELVRHDYSILKEALDRLLEIYFISFNQSPESSDQEIISKRLSDIIRCTPLTNPEIQFLLNSESDVTFPDKPLTMLVISAHELLLQKGAVGTYPKVQSAYLRQRLHLPGLKNSKQFNLFATKKTNGVYSDQRSGFVFCRKPAQHSN